ncbi:MAG: FkbM family methyltransferase, partial [Campylobacterales bacterium]|nr:FkbM family methyltransferase [Campylobacterales bacterium]
MTLKQKILRAVYSLGRKVFPSFYYPYKFLGGRIYLDITESLAVLSRARGFYEWPKQKLIYEFMPEGGVMIDIGANKGDFALIAAKKAGANGTVVAIEPDPLNSMLIRKSIEKNNYNYMKLLTCGVSSFNGILQFFIGKESSHNSMVQMEKNQRSIEIITRTLDSIVDDLNLDRVDLIKIDVEGADVEVLTSALNTLEKYRPTL